MSGVTDTYADDKKILTATFPTQGGANLAVKKLQELEKQGLLDVENTITVNKNALGQIDTSTKQLAIAAGKAPASAHWSAVSLG